MDSKSLIPNGCIDGASDCRLYANLGATVQDNYKRSQSYIQSMFSQIPLKVARISAAKSDYPSESLNTFRKPTS